jgi:hypothetical protein
MNTLLATDTLAFVDLKDSIDVLLSSVELNAPAAISECSLALFVTILGHKAKTTPSTLSDACEKIMRWLFLRWAPGRP